MRNRPIPTPALMNRRAFRDALDVAYLYNILGNSAHNSHAYDKHVGSYEEQVAELRVDPPFTDASIVPLTETWLRATFVPESEHDWRDCCALRLDPTPDDVDLHNLSATIVQIIKSGSNSQEAGCC